MTGNIAAEALCLGAGTKEKMVEFQSYIIIFEPAAVIPKHDSIEGHFIRFLKYLFHNQ